MFKLFALYMRPQKKLVIGAILFQVLATGAALLIPWVFAHIIDSVVPQKSFEAILPWGGFMLGLALAAMCIDIGASHCVIKSCILFVKQIRADIFAKTLQLSCTHMDKLTVASAISRATLDAQIIHIFARGLLKKGIRAPLYLVGSLIMCAILDIRLAVIVLMLIPIIGFIVYKTSQKSLPLFKVVRSMNDTFVKVLRENIIGIRVVKALSQTNYERERFNHANTSLRDQNIKAESVIIASSPLMDWVLNMGMVTTIIVGAWWVNAGVTMPGVIVAFMSYFAIILSSLLTVSQTFTAASKAQVAAERVLEVMNIAEQESFAKAHSKQENSVLTHPQFEQTHIAFDKVCFSYDGWKDTAPPTLDNLSFQLKKGQTLGIIGCTGAGKSTLLHVLLGLYTPQSGKVFLHGKDITTLPCEKLYNNFGIAFQSDTIFAATIRENIDFGRGLSDMAIQKAVQTAQASEFIDSLHDSIDNDLHIRGHNISGGQKQRLLIARALAANPEILIFDDSFSALDYKTDKQLRQALERNYAHTTKVIVSQRISSLIQAHTILVLDKGRIIASGTHEELLKNCPLYAQICHIQLGDMVKLKGAAHV